MCSVCFITSLFLLFRDQQKKETLEKKKKWKPEENFPPHSQIFLSSSNKFISPVLYGARALHLVLIHSIYWKHHGEYNHNTCVCLLRNNLMLCVCSTFCCESFFWFIFNNNKVEIQWKDLVSGGYKNIIQNKIKEKSWEKIECLCVCEVDFSSS